ncbi:MAG TPA: hypothetical protein VGO80_12490 [Solirubrobacteraceae bacterium]|jgi:hypothetical protein|nr:hypothetical protein [Solirubrobacteraceae bacterium]
MSSTLTGRASSIVDLSLNFRQAASLTVPDLHEITVPVTSHLTCELYFDSVHEAQGPRLLLTFNGEDVGEIVYEGEPGRKQMHVDLRDHLLDGANDFRIRALVSCLPLEAVSDSALVWLKNDESTVIRKAYSTRGSLEPFDQRWTLWFASDSAK